MSLNLDYLVEEALLEDVRRTGSLLSGVKLLEISKNGSNETYNPVQDVVLALDYHTKEKKEDKDYIKSALLILETIASVRNSTNDYFSASNATFVLRILAENKEFDNIGITPVKIIDLAKHYNENVVGSQYKISGEIDYARDNYHAKICLSPYSVKVIDDKKEKAA